MLKMLLSSLILCAGVALAGPKPSTVNPDATVKSERINQRDAGEKANTWKSCIADYRVNRSAVTNQLEQYETHLSQLATILTTGSDRVQLTNAIAALTGNAKTAANKSLNYEDAKDAKLNQMLNDLKAVGVNLKQMVGNLKSATQAMGEGK